MNVSKFGYDDRGAFRVLGLTTRLLYKTPTSIGFGLYACAVRMGTVERREKGWIDVHHPCEGHIKARLRIGLPYRVVARARESRERGKIITRVIDSVLRALEIPADETYEVTLHPVVVHADIGTGIIITRSVDRDGLSNFIWTRGTDAYQAAG